MPFAAGTLIRMSDNSTKAIELVTVTDTVKGYDAAGNPVNAAVNSITTYSARPVVTVQGVTCTRETNFLSPLGFKMIKEIGPQGFIYNTAENPFRAGSFTTPADCVVYGLDVAGLNTFVAGGWRVRG